MNRQPPSFDVWLEVASKEMTLVEISAVLETEPTPDLSIRLGDNAGLRRVHEWNRWRLGSSLPNIATLEEHLSDLLAMLEVIHLQETRGLLTPDAHVLVVVGVFPADGMYSASVRIEPQTLRALGELDLELYMSFYPS